MLRRAFISGLLSLPVLLVSGDAWSGSYLNRAALLLNGSRAERDMVLPRSNDKELVRVVHAVAKARSASARNMEIPKVIVAAHPHLLLVLENCERAYAAALASDYERFVDHILRARSEDQTFRALVKRLGYTLPNTK
jgi:hypothetical protein